MDHKGFFKFFGDVGLHIGDLGLSPYTPEDLYQAIKQRLIEELEVKNTVSDHEEYNPYLNGRLIDTGARR